ncbi:beta-1,3-galactosyltransferase brn-like isoform X2 [Saccostrea cucullata]
MTFSVFYLISYYKTKSKPRPVQVDETPLTEEDITKYYNFTQFNKTHPRLHYILSPLSVCDGFRTENNFSRTLIIVKSSAESFHIRKWFRWNIKQQKDIDNNFKIVFLLGQSPSSSMSELIKEESKLHNDMIQGNFTDNGNITTYKTIMGFNWALKYCQNSQFLLLQEENFKINYKNVMTFLEKEDDPESLYVGKLIRKEQTSSSNPDHVRYIPKEEYPLPFLPPYIAGGAYLVSMNVAKTLVSNFDSVKMVRVDDVFMGLVAMLSDVILVHSKKVTLENCAKFTKMLACRTFTSAEDILGAWEESFEINF